jgi:hypothetical protein
MVGTVHRAVLAACTASRLFTNHLCGARFIPHEPAIVTDIESGEEEALCIKPLAIDNYAVIMHYGCINKSTKAAGENVGPGSSASDYYTAKASTLIATRWSSCNTIERFPRSGGVGRRKAPRFL